MNSVKKKALLFVALFVVLAFVSTIPMPMAYGTEGGGGVGAWDSGTWTVDDYPTGATFIGSASTGGTGSIRYYASGYNDNLATGSLVYRKYFTPTDSSTHFELDYQWLYYCDANGFFLTVNLAVVGPTEWVNDLWVHLMSSGDGPTLDWYADNTHIMNMYTYAGHSYYYEVTVTIRYLRNTKSSAGHFCKSSSQLTTASYWNFVLSIT